MVAAILAFGFVTNQFANPRARVDWRWDYDGNRILGAVGKAAYLWDDTTGRILKRFDGLDDYASTVAFLPGGKQILIGTGGEGDTRPTSFDTAIRLLDIDSGKELCQYEGLKRHARSLCVSADGSLLLAVGSDSVAIEWDLKTGRQILSFGDVHSPYVPPSTPEASFSPDGRTIVAMNTYKIRLIDSASGRVVCVLSNTARGTQFTTAVFSGDNNRILTTQTEQGTDNLHWAHAATIWDAHTGAELKRFDFAGEDWMIGGYFAGNDQGFVTIFGKGAGIWSASTGVQKRAVKFPTDTMLFAPSNDLTRWMIRQGSSGVLVWNSTSGKISATVADAANMTAGPVSFSPNGRTFLIRDNSPYGEPQSMSVWDSDTGERLRHFQLESPGP